MGYTLTTQKFIEWKHTYYLWKVAELKGLTIYGKTVKEIEELAPDMIKEFIQARKEIDKENASKTKVHFKREIVCA